MPVHVVIPMAGHGSRFVAAGYTTPKPFIPVFDRPMIDWVIRSILPSGEKPIFHFVLQAAHLTLFSLDDICRPYGIEYTITEVQSVTEGAACTVLLTKEYINNTDPLITINSDQFIDWDVDGFYRSLTSGLDGCINTFEQPDPADTKWSFAKVEGGLVTEVAEKRYISSLATTGVYGWARGADFVAAAEEMIAANDRVNGEFYMCPVYTYLIRKGGKVGTYGCRRLWGLGVPEDLEFFLKNYQAS